MNPSSAVTIFALASFLAASTWSKASENKPAAEAPKLMAALGESVLLLDEHAVASTKGLKQQFFPAKKHPSNPVMRQTEAWEGVGPYVFQNRLLQDEQTGELRLWYAAHRPPIEYAQGYATSVNGLAWTKPDLAVSRFGDTTALNCLIPDRASAKVGSFARDPRPETPSHRRYMGLRFTYDYACTAFSSDGIIWYDYPLNPTWKVPSDASHVMWDDRRQKFIAYVKVWEVVGKEITPGGPAEGKPLTAYMPWFNKNELGDGTTAFDGPVITFHPPAPAEVELKKFVLRAGNQNADDGGGTSLSGEWSGKRIQVFAESEDGIHWTNEQVIIRADDKDPPTANIQIMFVIPYGGYYIGFLTLHDEAGHFRIHLAHSADGIAWQRPDARVPWLDVGPQGSFDSGMLTGPVDPIIWEREMWFPYGGFDILHDSQATDWDSAIGMATMRLDGFAAWEAGAESGELVTQPFMCNGDRLFVNAESQDGSLTVEVLNEQGNPLPGFEADSCEPVTTDTLAKDSGQAGWIRWKAEQDLARLQGQRIQLRFTMKNARLYSFRVADKKTEKLPTPRATTE